MKEKLLIIIYIIVFSTFSYLCNENELNQKWWANASVTDVEERFKAYKHLRYRDAHGRNLLHLACLYSKDSAIPEYFIWRGIPLYRQDRKGNRAYDYAINNPNLVEFAEKMKILESIDYDKRLRNLQAKGIAPNIDLLIPKRRIEERPMFPAVRKNDIVIFKYYKPGPEETK